MNPHPLRDRHARQFGAVLLSLLVATQVSARQLPNVDALADAPAVPLAKALREDGRVSRFHADERLGTPSFLWVRPGAAIGGRKSMAGLAPQEAARRTLEGLADLYGMSPAEAAAAEVKTAERLGGGGHLVRFQNRLDGIEVFRESAAVILSESMQPVAIGGRLGATTRAPKLAKSAKAPFTLSAAQAIAAALGDYNFGPEVVGALRPVAQTPATAASVAAGYQYFAAPRDLLSPDGARLDEAARAKRVWFRLPGGLVPAWYVELQMRETRLPGLDYYGFVIAADDGRLLFRNNQSAHAAFTYRVYGEAAGAYLPLPSPVGRGATPHPTGLNDGFVPPFVPGNLVTLQNGPISTNDPWLPVGATRTDGNNVTAFSNRFNSGTAQPGGDGLDVDPAECNVGVAATADFRACTTSASTFDHAYDHNAEPLANKSQSAAAVTNLFYMVNWLHDWFYDAGFKEADGNAQFDNYGRGGLGGDPMKAQAEDNAGVNNANMLTPSDGARPRMRMYVFQGRAYSSLTATPGGAHATGTASFGPSVFNVTADLVLAADSAAPTSDACTAIQNNVVGKVVLVDRGSCTFIVKAQNVQAAGGVGMILANNAAGATPPGLGGTDPSVTIGSLSVTLDSGNALKAALAGAVSVTMTRSKDPDRDGALDNAIVAHEWGHYISNRLVADANGLGTNHARGLGEGWADFHSLLMMLKEGDPLGGVYGVGGYAADGAAIAGNTVPNPAHYAGFRRYPYSSDLAKNPLTFKHIADENALPASPPPNGGGPNSEVHNTGEIWASMLWQCYTAIAGDGGRLSFAQAQDRMKRYLVAGYKLTPASPTLLEARDALLAAMAAQDPADLALCAQAFATRGAGVRAVAPDRFSTSNNGVVESFVAGGDMKIESLAFDPRGDAYCDADGVLDNGETAFVRVVVRNTGTVTLDGAVVSLSSATPGIAFANNNAVLPPIAPFATMEVAIRVTLAGAVAPGFATVDASVTHPSFAVPTPATASILLPTHYDRAPASAAVDDAESEVSAWATSFTGGAPFEALRWQRGGDLATGRYYKAQTGSGATVSWLTSPSLTVAAPGTVTMTIRHRHDFEFDGTVWDGGVIEVSFDDGNTWTDLQALVPGVYNATIAGDTNPLFGRAAFGGQSAGYPAFNTVAFPIPATAGAMRVRFGAATDMAVGAQGWDVDDISFSGIANTPFESTVPNAGTCATLLVASGSPQVTGLGDDFGSPFVARLLSPGGIPVAGAAVAFEAPATGASGTFGGTSPYYAVVTDASGYATSPVFKANVVAGTYAVTATAGQRSAAFVLSNAAAFALTVTRHGTGTGTVTTPGIDCGATCAAVYVAGASLTLTATPGPGSRFAGWSGACSGTGACQVTMGGVRTVTATFGPLEGRRGDADGDGRADLYWREPSGTGLSWWTMNGGAALGANYYDVAPEWQVIDVADLDGDGKSDLVWRRAADGATYLWTLGGLAPSGYFDLGVLDPATWHYAGSADFDGDGKSDLLWRNAVTGEAYAWLMNGGTIAAQGPVPSSPDTSWAVVDLADFDGDGRADILWRRTDGDTYVYFMNGLALAGAVQVLPQLPATQWSIVAAADFNGDGEADLLWRSTTGEAWVWLLDGGAVTGSAQVAALDPAWSVRAVGDFDGDGKDDIVWRHADGTTYFWRMDGLTVAGSAPVVNPGASWQVVAP
ncbi:MAG: M36 family metallopeptidase [Burkholderiales bacterium]|nr:M36 family metallopeptidase [Burkholderiales bacterium]